MNTQALRLSALVAAAMSAGYLWRAALDGDVPQKVLAGAPSELRAEVAKAPFSSLTLIRPASAATTESATDGAVSQTASAPQAAGATLVAFAPRTARNSHSRPHSPGRSKAAGKGKAKSSRPKP